MNEEYLSRLFKRKIGQTLIHYLQQLRVNHAKVYLEQPDLPIGIIGEQVGFANQSYFFEVFKRWMNTTPSEYRETRCAAHSAVPPPLGSK